MIKSLPSPVNFVRALIQLFLVIAGLIVITHHAVAQSQFSIEVNITVKESKKKIEGALVKITKNGKDGEKKTTDKSGRADFVLFPNNEYLITVSKTGYVSKSIEMNTHWMPNSNQAALVYRTKPSIEIVKYVEGMDTAVFSKPMGKFAFNTETNDFFFDFDYTETRHETIVKSGVEFQQKEKARLEHRARYDSLIMEADKILKMKNYNAAKETYTEARAILPDETYAAKKIIEINSILAEAMEANKKADQEAREQAAAEAKRKASELAKLFAEEEEKMMAIKKQEKEESQKLQAQNEAKQKENLSTEAKRKDSEDAKRSTYNQIIVRADQYFIAKEYNAAKAAYKEGLAMYNEVHPKDKIAEIERLLVKQNGESKPGEKEIEAFTSELAKKYPQGITEEIIKESNRTIIRRIVVRGNEGNEYTKIMYNWGTYYFKNRDNSISETNWMNETK